MKKYILLAIAAIASWLSASAQLSSAHIDLLLGDKMKYLQATLDLTPGQRDRFYSEYARMNRDYGLLYYNRDLQCDRHYPVFYDRYYHDHFCNILTDKQLKALIKAEKKAQKRIEKQYKAYYKAHSKSITKQKREHDKRHRKHNSKHYRR